MPKYIEINGYDGFYRVGDDGSVWTRRITGRGKNKYGEWRRMKPTPHIRSGHLLVGLSKNGKTTSKYVHLLVLECFKGVCPPGMEARHFPDRSPSNNCVDNLVWGTRQENQIDRVTHGTSNRGERCAVCKLTEEKVRRIRYLRERFNTTFTELSLAFNVNPGTIHAITKRRTWKHVQ